MSSQPQSDEQNNESLLKIPNVEDIMPENIRDIELNNIHDFVINSQDLEKFLSDFGNTIDENDIKPNEPLKYDNNLPVNDEIDQCFDVLDDFLHDIKRNNEFKNCNNEIVNSSSDMINPDNKDGFVKNNEEFVNSVTNVHPYTKLEEPNTEDNKLNKDTKTHKEQLRQFRNINKNDNSYDALQNSNSLNLIAIDVSKKGIDIASVRNTQVENDISTAIANNDQHCINDIKYNDIDQLHNAIDTSIENAIKTNTENVQHEIKMLENDGHEKHFHMSGHSVKIGGREIANIKHLINDGVDAVSKDLKTISNLNTEEYEDVDSDCSGYHSSDFEFITESEARKEGLVVNNLKTTKRSTKAASEKSKARNSLSNCKKYMKNDDSLNRPGSSKDNIANHHKSKGRICTNADIDSINDQSTAASTSYSKTTKNITVNSNNTHEINICEEQNHQIPEGDAYLDLFRDYAPIYSELHFLENKSIRAQTCMNIQYEGIGFDITLAAQDDCNKEFSGEAAETARKILVMYPLENKGRKRRCRF